MARFTKRERIKDSSLREAVERAELGLVDADLGGGIIKQWVARPGQGRSGGYRTILGFRAKDRAIFLYGLAKSERANIGTDELETAREIAAVWLAADAASIARGIASGERQEIGNDD